MKPIRDEDIPKATHEGTAELLGVKIRIYRLDDGRAVIHADDFHKVLAAMGITEEDWTDLAAKLA